MANGSEFSEALRALLPLAGASGLAHLAGVTISQGPEDFVRLSAWDGHTAAFIDVPSCEEWTFKGSRYLPAKQAKLLLSATSGLDCVVLPTAGGIAWRHNAGRGGVHAELRRDEPAAVLACCHPGKALESWGLTQGHILAGQIMAAAAASDKKVAGFAPVFLEGAENKISAIGTDVRRANIVSAAAVVSSQFRAPLSMESAVLLSRLMTEGDVHLTGCPQILVATQGGRKIRIELSTMRVAPVRDLVSKAQITAEFSVQADVMLAAIVRAAGACEDDARVVGIQRSGPTLRLMVQAQDAAGEWEALSAEEELDIEGDALMSPVKASAPFLTAALRVMRGSVQFRFASNMVLLADSVGTIAMVALIGDARRAAA